MRTPRAAIIIGVGIAVLCSACSSTSTVVVCGTRPHSPATLTNGPLTVATDHTLYAPTDRIVVVITNHIEPGIQGTAQSRYCPFAAMQQLQGTTWVPVSICFPEEAGEAPTVPPTLVLGPEQSYTIHLVDMTVSTIPAPRPFPTGTFRLVVRYSAAFAHGLEPPTVAYSADIHICTCGSCA